MDEDYPDGTEVLCNDVEGVVVPNYKMEDDICIKWESGLESSYDKDWLNENVIIIKKGNIL